ncbi:cold shock-induced protein TIR1-like [Tachysurus ichikawai]
MFGLQTKKWLTTQFSPFYLMFGREAQYPSKVPEHNEVDGSFYIDSEQETVAIDNERHKKIMDIVDFNVSKNKQQKKKKAIKSNPTKPSDGWPTCKVNIDHLKHHHEETPRIPHKLRRHQQFAPSQPPNKTSSPAPPADSSPPPPADFSPTPPADSSPPPPADSSPLPSGYSPPPPVDSSPLPLADSSHPPPADSSPLPPADSSPPPPADSSPPPPADSSPLPPTDSSSPPVANSTPHATADPSLSPAAHCSHHATADPSLSPAAHCSRHASHDVTSFHENCKYLG